MNKIVRRLKNWWSKRRTQRLIQEYWRLKAKLDYINSIQEKGVKDE